jgi:hypothetical protein
MWLDTKYVSKIDGPHRLLKWSNVSVRIFSVVNVLKNYNVRRDALTHEKIPEKKLDIK